MYLQCFSFHARNPTIIFQENRGKNREWFEPSPYGMVYIPRESFRMGPSDDEVTRYTPTKTVTTEAFWMDDTEITNNEYRQFVYWVRDSIARKLLGETYTDFIVTENQYGAPLDEPIINWVEKIDWKDPDYLTAMDDLVYSRTGTIYKQARS